MHPIRISFSDQRVSFTHAPVKIQAFLIHAVQCAALCQPLSGYRFAHFKKDGRIRHQSLCRKLIHLLDLLHADLPAHALIGEGTVDEPVTKHDLALIQRRDHPFHQMLAAARRIKQRFGARVHRDVGRIQDDVPDLLGDVDAARFPGQDAGTALLQELLIDQLADGGLPASVISFKGDKQSPAHSVTSFNRYVAIVP